MSLCLIPQILHTLREGIYHHCLGRDPEIPQKRVLRESYKESLSFILKSIFGSDVKNAQQRRCDGFHVLIDSA